LIQGRCHRLKRSLNLHYNYKPTCLSQESGKLIMTKEQTTADKSNAYKIRIVISQVIFKQLIVKQGDEILKDTAVGRFDNPLLSALANIATSAIMNEPRLNVVLRKG